VAEIASLCGHLPLAVRIAGALLRNRPTWSLEHLVDKLHAARARLEEFSGGDRDVAALFGLSSQALREDQRRLYGCLGLVPGPEVDGYAAAALLDIDLAMAERLLQELVDHNLLLEPAAGRYRMHDLIRAHARALTEHAPAQEREAAFGRLLDYYQHTAGRADARLGQYPWPWPWPVGPAPAHAPALSDADAARVWLRAERANLTACLQHAIGGAQDGRTVECAAGLAGLLRTDGPWPQARVPNAAAAARLGDRSGQARALTELGNLRRLTGDYPGADRSLRAALELYREAGDKLGQARALTGLGIARRVSGNYRGADRSLRAALELYREAGDKLGQARALTEVAEIQALAGGFAGAGRSLWAALELYREAGDKPGQARALTELAEIQARTGSYAGATRNGEAALAICEELGDGLGQGNVLTVLGKVRRLTGDYQGARRHHMAALEVYKKLGGRRSQANARTLLAEIRRLTGDYRGAARDLEESISTYRDLGNRGSQAWALNHYAAAIADTGDLTRAIALYHDALHLAREVHQPDDEAIALQGLGETRLLEGKLQDGASYLRQALEIYQRLGVPAAEQVLARLAGIGAPPPGLPLRYGSQGPPVSALRRPGHR
jgi:tetratricopeptide (TPR) repeat protein